MKCEDAINRYCELDKNESLPFRLSMHILFCRRCKAYIDTMEELIKGPSLLSNKMPDHTLAEIMQKINQVSVEATSEKEIIPTLLKFFFVLVFFVILFIIVPTLIFGNMLSGTLGFVFALIIGLLCAFIVSIVSAIFVIKNTKYLIKNNKRNTIL